MDEARASGSGRLDGGRMRSNRILRRMEGYGYIWWTRWRWRMDRAALRIFTSPPSFDEGALDIGKADGRLERHRWATNSSTAYCYDWKDVGRLEERANML